MTAKEYLNQIHKLERSALRIAEQIEYLESKFGYHPLQLDDSGGSHGTPDDDIMADILGEVTELEVELKRKMLDYAKRKREAIELIEQIPKETYKDLLIKRYIEVNRAHPDRLKSFEMISVEMGYSFNSMKKMHSRALKEFDGIYKMSTQSHQKKD